MSLSGLTKAHPCVSRFVHPSSSIRRMPSFSFSSRPSSNGLAPAGSEAEWTLLKDYSDDEASDHPVGSVRIMIGSG